MNRRATVRSRSTLFQSGTRGYHTFGIPAVAAMGNGAVVVAAEGGGDALRDWGQIDVVVRRSVDGGRTFDAHRTVMHEPGYISGNPCFVFDARSNTLALL